MWGRWRPNWRPTPNERQFKALVTRVHRALFESPEASRPALPLAGRKLQVHTDWRRDLA